MPFDWSNRNIKFKCQNSIQRKHTFAVIRCPVAHTCGVLATKIHKINNHWWKIKIHFSSQQLNKYTHTNSIQLQTSANSLVDFRCEVWTIECVSIHPPSPCAFPVHANQHFRQTLLRIRVCSMRHACGHVAEIRLEQPSPEHWVSSLYDGKLRVCACVLGKHIQSALNRLHYEATWHESCYDFSLWIK